jgi:uncharacterized protein DUF1579
MRILVSALVLGAGSWVQAQTPPAPAAPASQPAPAATPAPPQPALELQKLSFLVGDWVHDEVHHPGAMGPGGPAKGRSKAQWILGDHHLYLNYVSRGAMGSIEARGLLGWDADKKAYHLDWYDNLGQAVRYQGDFNPEGALLLSAEYTLNGQRVKEELTIKRQEGGKVLFVTALPGPDGALKPVFESTATPDKK